MPAQVHAEDANAKVTEFLASTTESDVSQGDISSEVATRIADLAQYTTELSSKGFEVLQAAVQERVKKQGGTQLAATLRVATRHEPPTPWHAHTPIDWLGFSDAQRCVWRGRSLKRKPAMAG
eukprot:COSAG01_NODE_12016_length_1816_cov_2.455446_3_plen_122_part_00